MQSIAKLMKNQLFAVSRLVWRLTMVVLGCLITAPSLVHAHGGMSGQEVGPPMITSGLLGFVCYWLVMLWPSAKKGDTEVEPNTQSQPVSPTRRHAHQNSARFRQRPRLRKIERSGQVVGNVNSGRKATDV